MAASALAFSSTHNPAQDAYGLLHGGLGHGSLEPHLTSYTAPGMGATPRATCAKGDRPETDIQGRAPLRDFLSGRAAKGYTCQATDVGHEGDGGGFQTWRYVDHAGHVCAFYDGTLLFPVREIEGKPGGTVVLDMSNPAKPRRTAVLGTLAMRTPHESLRLNAKRGLLVAVAGSPATQVGEVDVYDVSKDCRAPVLRSSLPVGILGHEGAFSPDGRTYWASTTADRGLTAIDLTDPAKPVVVMHSFQVEVHGLSISDDGMRAYLADVSNGPTQNYVSEITHGGGGMRVLDISQVQKRVAVPQIKSIGFVTWPEVTIPQSTIPITVHGHKYLVEFDEYDSNTTAYSPDENVGGVRIIDISHETRPRVVSRMRLAVWERGARATSQQDDPGAHSGTQGYAAHYCSVPQRKDPGILACSTIVSGLRVFDISNPLRPREVAYANHPGYDAKDPASSSGAAAMSAPTFDIARRQVWYADGNSGFWVERLSAKAWPQ
ncbi:MAG: hypothetical protein JWM40_1034 [Frankiales bacterium]|nr:hypothetical protein [Frankiales bacterium]